MMYIIVYYIIYCYTIYIVLLLQSFCIIFFNAVLPTSSHAEPTTHRFGRPQLHEGSPFTAAMAYGVYGIPSG